LRVSDFDFSLPDELIALRPASPRDAARLLIVHEGASAFEEARVSELPLLLAAGDICVFNDSRVIKARLNGVRLQRGSGAEAAIEVTLHKRESENMWAAFAKPGRKLIPGDVVMFGPSLTATVQAKKEGGEIVLCFNQGDAALDRTIAEIGVTPLPPYVADRRAADQADVFDYQTVYALHDGAVAAPTAGLHFTPALLKALAARGVGRAHVTLHVGAGTFVPVKAGDTDDHVMHAERADVPASTASAVNATRMRSGRVVCVGTTSLRAIESAADRDGHVTPLSGETRLFITPGYRFKATDVLLTNFHLPRSTLFMLVSAFCGLETMRRAYAHAIERRFRFYSYGDACLLMRKQA